MLKHRYALLMVLIVLVLLCSCNSNPEPSKDVEKVAGAGLLASNEIIIQYNDAGSYPGVSVRTANNSICFNMTNASVEVDLSPIDPSMGKHTIVVNGEVAFTYEAYPASYPCAVAYSISFSYAGKNHTLEVKWRETGVSSRKCSLLKVDGTIYDPSVLDM